MRRYDAGSLADGHARDEAAQICARPRLGQTLALYASRVKTPERRSSDEMISMHENVA